MMAGRKLFWFLVHFNLTVLLLASEISSGDVEINLNEKRLHLNSDQKIIFESKPIDRSGLANPLHWTEMNERSTSKNYTLWNKAKVFLVEWPGNITVRDAEWPLLKWAKPRAKYLINRCCESFVGIEMRAYAYRYLFLTWGPFRFSMTYSPPLTIPAQLLRNHSKGLDYDSRHPFNTTELVVADFAFVHDALLLAMFEDEVVVRVYGLEMAYVEIGLGLEEALEPLKYSVANGISSPVNKLVGQYCCVKMETGECPHGETVVAYKEHVSDFRIFVSTDGGENFKMVEPSVPKTSFHLHAVLSYPDTGKILLLHGTERTATLDSYSMSSGAVISGGSSSKFNGISGTLQASRIGEEMSLIIWDKCNVWYSLGEGRNVTKAVFYVHGFIRRGKRSKKHYILPQYCKFGANSALAVSSTGKLALLDTDNHFHLGIDTKSSVFQLVAMKVDMSLVLERHSLSIVPHFDHSQHPKLVYPPRYLEQPDKALLGSNYSQRLGLRLLPKTVFPHEFIAVFYEENAWLPKKFKNFALRPCQTSSISVNRSISQKPKFYTFKPNQQVNFTIRFKSRVNSRRQLHYEPSSVNKFLHVRLRLVSIVETEPEDGPQYWFTYSVTIKSRSLTLSNRVFLINFFTWKTLRCNVQPSSPVYILITDTPYRQLHPLHPFLSDDDESRPSFVKVNDQKPKYDRTKKATEQSCSCSGSKCKKPKSKENTHFPHPQHPMMMHSEL